MVIRQKHNQSSSLLVSKHIDLYPCFILTLQYQQSEGDAATAEATAQHGLTNNPFTVSRWLQLAHSQGKAVPYAVVSGLSSCYTTGVYVCFCFVLVCLHSYVCCVSGYGYGGGRSYLRERLASLNLLSLVASPCPLCKCPAQVFCREMDSERWILSAVLYHYSC